MSNKPRFTKKQIETAIEVLKASSMVRKWVKSQADFLGIDLDTPRGQEFYEKNATEYAHRLIM